MFRPTSFISSCQASYPFLRKAASHCHHSFSSKTNRIWGYLAPSHAWGTNSSVWFKRPSSSGPSSSLGSCPAPRGHRGPDWLVRLFPQCVPWSFSSQNPSDQPESFLTLIHCMIWFNPELPTSLMAELTRLVFLKLICLWSCFHTYSRTRVSQNTPDNLTYKGPSPPSLILLSCLVFSHHIGFAYCLSSPPECLLHEGRCCVNSLYHYIPSAQNSNWKCSHHPIIICWCWVNVPFCLRSLTFLRFGKCYSTFKPDSIFTSYVRYSLISHLSVLNRPFPSKSD